MLSLVGIDCEIKWYYLSLEQKEDDNKKAYIFDSTSKKYDSSMILQ